MDEQLAPADELPVAHFELERLVAVGTDGLDPAVAVKRAWDAERVPGAVSVPLAVAGVHSERRRYGGKGVCHPDLAALVDDESLRRLHDEHALVLEPDGSAIRMLSPFSGVPTPYRVEAGGRSWFGNCVWDALGIPAALGVDGHVSATCLDCGDTLEVDVVAGRPEPDDLVAHFLLPAERWWDDIVFT